ncbi:MAG: hypothetical protein QGD94_08675 [Planctomycetia bacterium]|nr:hypothetical protein [Planctomycetia bacterium]
MNTLRVAVIGLSGIPASGAEGLAVMPILDAIYLSARSKEPVRMTRP